VRSKLFSRARVRLRQIERIIAGRHGRVPATDDADLYLSPVANCFCVMAAERGRAHSVEDVLRSFDFWCDTWAPGISKRDVNRIASEAFSAPPKLAPDDAVGERLRLSYAERRLRKAYTIGSFDADRTERKRRTRSRKKERDRVKVAEKRRSKGAKPRAIYEAESLARTKPWEAEGISRRTWERRRKKAATADAIDASPSPHPSTVDASASPCLLSYNGRQTCVMPMPTVDGVGEIRALKAPRRLAPPVPPDVLVGEIIDHGDVGRAPQPSHLDRAIARVRHLVERGCP
jgi:hypothetical protein